MRSARNITLFFLWLVALTGCQTEQESINLTLAHGLDNRHPVHLAMVHLDEQLRELSQGTMHITIYPSGQLGSEREVIELLQIGSLAMTKVSASSLEAFVPEMKIFSLPYLFEDNDHFWRVLNSDLGQQLLAAGDRYRVRGLGYYDAGSRSFYATEAPIHAPADLAGKKIRVMNSQSAINMVRAMGGAATPVSWGELYTALQQGVVDGAENNPPSFYLSKHYEVARYYTLDEHTAIPDVMIIGTHVWDALNPQQQAWLKTAMDRSTEYQRALWQQASDEALAAVEAAGVTVIRPDKTLFQTSVKDYLASQSSLLPLMQQIAAEASR
ncbi:TRAP transporter substrate-binding protein [Simiduia agarivorans]|uniref:Carbon storage regulator n=1 Tax=Simiduia agarivorans (strain DSM 21679 / JCM 13881 / BCRC 17597 / SA1) TaxID=1117647 RepID=K4KKR6_SIMAS|nr:TRAP transporter substrate-binding protein [Simiduia agarivorans]AFU98815.1 carbon storage regulator [Simiduia agarivorans SA1 = DSM 21679]